MLKQPVRKSSIHAHGIAGGGQLVNDGVIAVLEANTMDLGGFSLAWLRDLAFCAALEAERDSW